MTNYKIYQDGVELRTVNRRVVIRRHKRNRNCVILQIWSVNKDNGLRKEHVNTQARMNLRYTGMGLSFEALRDIAVATNLYHKHIEAIDENSVLY